MGFDTIPQDFMLCALQMRYGHLGRRTLRIRTNASETLNDRATAPLPLDGAEARRLIQGLKAWPLLAGARGKPAADIDALIQLLVALGAFAADHADLIEELDLNPVIVHGSGVSLVDGLLVQRR